MIQISKEKNIAFRKRFLGKRMKFLIISEKNNTKICLSPNYIHAYIDCDEGVNTVIDGELSFIGEEREDNVAKIVKEDKNGSR